MSEFEIVTNPHYLRAEWMLRKQIRTAQDLIQFWRVFGLETK